MKKAELIHLHGLLARVREEFQEKFGEIEARRYDSEFSGVTPYSIHRSKSDHKAALFSLSEPLADFDPVEHLLDEVPEEQVDDPETYREVIDYLLEEGIADAGEIADDMEIGYWKAYSTVVDLDNHLDEIGLSSSLAFHENRVEKEEHTEGSIYT